MPENLRTVDSNGNAQDQDIFKYAIAAGLALGTVAVAGHAMKGLLKGVGSKNIPKVGSLATSISPSEAFSNSYSGKGISAKGIEFLKKNWKNTASETLNPDGTLLDAARGATDPILNAGDVAIKQGHRGAKLAIGKGMEQQYQWGKDAFNIRRDQVKAFNKDFAGLKYGKDYNSQLMMRNKAIDMARSRGINIGDDTVDALTRAHYDPSKKLAKGKVSESQFLSKELEGIYKDFGDMSAANPNRDMITTEAQRAKGIWFGNRDATTGNLLSPGNSPWNESDLIKPDGSLTAQGRENAAELELSSNLYNGNWDVMEGVQRSTILDPERIDMQEVNRLNDYTRRKQQHEIEQLVAAQP